MAANESAADRTFVITRTYDAPARLVYEAFKPEQIKKWFGPKDWPVTMIEMDFRVGGKWRMAMTGPSGKQNTPFGGTILEIVPNRKISWDNGFEAPGSERMVMTYAFDEKDGKTTLTFTTVFGSIAMKNSHLGMGFSDGSNSAFDQLTDVVASLRSTAK